MTRRKLPSELRNQPTFNVNNSEIRLRRLRAEIEEIIAGIDAALLHMSRLGKPEKE